MQTLIDIPEEVLTSLDRISRAEQMPREAIIEHALTAYISTKQEDLSAADKEKRRLDALDATFGIWKDRGEDALDFQRRVRGE